MNLELKLYTGFFFRQYKILTPNKPNILLLLNTQKRKKSGKNRQKAALIMQYSAECLFTKL